MAELRNDCRSYEIKIIERVNYYQENAGSIVLETLLKSVMNISFIRMMQSWLGNEQSGSKTEDASSQNQMLHTAITLGLSLGLKYFNKLFK